MPRARPPLLPALLLVLLAACAPVDDGDALPEQSGLKIASGRRCGHCGRIESKREIALRVYEYTLRMADGSSSVFEETLPTTWRVGERVGVIEGSDPALN
jgi:hypothetical protein